MLARRSTLHHPMGGTIETACLVPSFTSKGFPFFKEPDTKRKLSETSYMLEQLAPAAYGPILVSAYDLFHGHYKEPEEHLQRQDLVFVDSGGYELSKDWDPVEPKELPHDPIRFTLDNYLETLGKLPKEAQCIIANYDWGTRYEPMIKQILDAQALFHQFPKYMYNFIIKPTSRDTYLNIDEHIIPEISKMRNFHIIGVTEKELATNLLDRLKAISKLRAALDREGIKAPIHIWGGLDPVITVLYCLAGAEIFDGVSWLRYGFFNGSAMYRDSCGVLFNGIKTKRDTSRLMVAINNLEFLSNLSTDLRSFVDNKGKNFSCFTYHSEVFERAYKVLCTEVPALKGGL